HPDELARSRVAAHRSRRPEGPERGRVGVARRARPGARRGRGARDVVPRPGLRCSLRACLTGIASAPRPGRAREACLSTLTESDRRIGARSSLLNKLEEPIPVGLPSPPGGVAALACVSLLRRAFA